MIVYILTYGGEPRVDFTTDFSFWYYFKPLINRMWHVDTLGM